MFHSISLFFCSQGCLPDDDDINSIPPAAAELDRASTTSRLSSTNSLPSTLGGSSSCSRRSCGSSSRSRYEDGRASSSANAHQDMQQQQQQPPASVIPEVLKTPVVVIMARAHASETPPSFIIQVLYCRGYVIAIRMYRLFRFYPLPER